MEFLCVIFNKNYFSYEDKKGFYRVTFTTEEGGYRTFVNGEEYEFHRTVSKNASRVIITYGLVKYMYAHDEVINSFFL